MLLEEVTQKLREHALRFNLEQRAIEGCRRALQTLLEEEPEETRRYLGGLPPEEVDFQFVKHELVFQSPQLRPHILSRVMCGTHDEFWVFDVRPLGYYELETGENGEASDDWFWWEEMRDEEGKLIESSGVSE